MYNKDMKDKKNEAGPVRLYSTKEVESMWGISRWRIYGLVNTGKIRPIVNMGKGWKWDGSEFNKELLERL
jgi:predicted DNA-binding transcriptional regulator AlpA